MQRMVVFSNALPEKSLFFLKGLRTSNPSARITVIINDKELVNFTNNEVDAEFLTYNEYKWARNPLVALSFITKLLFRRFDAAYVIDYFLPTPVISLQGLFMLLTRARKKIGVHPDGKIEDFKFPIKGKRYYEHAAEQRSGKRKKMLYVTPTLPYPPNYGGNIRMFGLLKHFNEKYNVTLIAYGTDKRYYDETARYCAKLVVVYHDVLNQIFFSDASWIKFFALIFLRGPAVRTAHSSQSLKDAISDCLRETQYDIIQVEHAYMASYIPDNLKCIKVIDKHNIDSIIMSRAAIAQANPLLKMFHSVEAERMKAFETSSSEKFDVIMFDTENDRDRFRMFSAKFGDVRAIPTGVDMDSFPHIGPNPDSFNLISIGTMSWQPNVDGIIWFYSGAFKKLRKRFPGMKFYVIGHRPLPELVELGRHDPAVIVTGFVDDVTSYLKDSSVFVVPLRIGSGMRIKILNAMSWGFPVVTTNVGCEGMKVTPGDDILVADDPATFSEHIIKLLENRKMAEEIGLKARKLIEEVYDWNVIYRQFDELYDEILQVKQSR